MKIFNFCFVFFLVSILQSTAIFAQTEYRSTKSGNWGDADTWERKSNANWVKVSGIPGVDVTVLIQKGHVITVDNTLSPSCANLVIEANGELKAEGSPTLKIGYTKRGDDSYIINNGTISSGSTPAEGLIRLDVFNTAKKVIISGSGKTKFGRLQARGGNPNKLEIIIDQDITITEKIVTSTFTLLDVLPNRRTNSDDVTLTINKGKTVKIEGASTFHNAIATAETGGKYVYNILGTLDISANETTDNVIPVSDNAKGETIVNVAGHLIIGGYFNAVNKAPSGTDDGKVELNVLDGGVIDATKAKKITLGKVQFNTQGTGTVKR